MGQQGVDAGHLVKVAAKAAVQVERLAAAAERLATSLEDLVRRAAEANSFWLCPPGDESGPGEADGGLAR